MKKLWPGILGIILALLIFVVSAQAYTITDNYWGGVPNHSGYDRDIIGDYSRFGVDSLSVNVSGNSMTVIINTPYARSFTEGKTFGFAPGDLFISTNGWNPYGAGPQYTADTHGYGERWEFGVNGSGVYGLSGKESAIVNSTLINGYDPSRWVYRAGQEWTFNSEGLASLGNASMTIDGVSGTITYVLDISGMGLTGNEALGFHWTMQCGNDVIEGAAPVPEPSTMLLLGSGLVGLWGIRKKRKGHRAESIE